MSDTSKKPPLLPAYLFLGDDELKKKVLLERLTKRLSAEGDLSFDSVSFDATTFKDTERFYDACNTLPFMSPLRLVTVKAVDKAVKPLTEAIISYLKAPAESTVLVLTAEKLAKNARLLTALRAISEKAVVDAATKKRSELPQMVRSLAKGRGVTMGGEAATELINRVGTSTVALDKELEKLASFAFASGRSSLEREDVRALVERSAEISPWDFVEAVFSGSLAQALVVRQRLIAEKPHALLALSVMRLRELLAARALLDRGRVDLATALKRPDWQVRRLRATAERFKAAKLRELLIYAADCDRQMKSGSDPELALEKFVAAACGF
ncbi:MAG: DNA polymerase III subunit delta [Coriobacteriales bacterium]|jgi:DNA polymerase-3 subunit delta|nr:DNA polymerase III subunit delta [Coriobacteriales bacterium]